MRTRRSAALAALALVVVLAGCAPGETPADGVVVIECASCQPSPTDPGLQYYSEAVERFNEQFEGRYRVEVTDNQMAGSSLERLQHYQRLALAGDLPDVFAVAPTEVAELQSTGAMLDFTPLLADDPDWKASFFDGAFAALQGTEGQTWAIPTQRDAIGIFYNTEMLRAAGVEEFPTTWDALTEACDAITRNGDLCFAMDGGWVTWLMWANLIGTQSGGEEFLAGGIRDLDYADQQIVVAATEYLRSMYEAGHVNQDSMAGDFVAADNLFITEQAAMIANGPWEVTASINGPNASPDLYGRIGYAASPGWVAGERGVILMAGEGGLASGADEPEKVEAVAAFMKFLTSRNEMVIRAQATSTFPPVDIAFTPEELDDLEPLAAGLLAEAELVSHTFNHVPFAAPAGFTTAWLNLWPAYLQGQLDTKAFLGQLADAAAGTGS